MNQALLLILLVPSHATTGLKFPAHVSKLHLHTPRKPPVGHSLGWGICIWRCLLSLGGQTRTRPTQTLEAGPGPLGIPGLWSKWWKRGVNVSIVLWPLGLPTLRKAEARGKAELKSMKAWDSGKKHSFSSPREILPVPRRVHRGDPGKWTEFRAQTKSIT